MIVYILKARKILAPAMQRVMYESDPMYNSLCNYYPEPNSRPGHTRCNFTAEKPKNNCHGAILLTDVHERLVYNIKIQKINYT